MLYLLKAHLEDLAEKDATEKSDAAREAFLAELALDSKKSSGNGNDNLKNMQEKVKDKKRNKDFKRSRDSKVCIALSVLGSIVSFLHCTWLSNSQI